MNFSLILPSRERLPLLEGFLNSVLATAANPNSVEAWIAIDWDDTPMVRAKKRLEKEYPWTNWLITDRQGNMSKGYYNRLAALSEGKFIQLCNDDCKFVTQHWDLIGLDLMENYKRIHPDGIFLGKCRDDLKEGYACFPVLSREAFNAIGWVQHPEFTSWGCDIHINDMFSRLNRIVELPYDIEHLCHHTSKRERDNVSMRMGQMARYNYGSAAGEAMRIQNIIDNHKHE